VAEIKALNCPNCGGSIPDTSKVCSFCGSKVILAGDKTKFVLAGKICTKCGIENNYNSRFCSNCGERLSVECLMCQKDIEMDAVHCPYCGINIESKIQELIKSSGSQFLSIYPQYKYRCNQMIEEMQSIDKQLQFLQEQEQISRKQAQIKFLQEQEQAQNLQKQAQIDGYKKAIDYCLNLRRKDVNTLIIWLISAFGPIGFVLFDHNWFFLLWSIFLGIWTVYMFNYEGFGFRTYRKIDSMNKQIAKYQKMIDDLK
jgi:transcription elongation factor Elf1